MQRSFESNVSLVHFLTLAALVWMSTRRDLSKPVVPLLVALTLIASYKESYLWDSLDTISMTHTGQKICTTSKVLAASPFG